jgi:hypothetical protein
MHEHGYTFEVDDVPIAQDRFPNIPASQAIVHLLSRPSLINTVTSWEFPSFTRIKDAARSLQPEPSEGCGIEACSGENRQLIRGVSVHALVFAAHASFCFHYPLTLSPDMIWLLIVQGVAEHVNANAAKLRRMLVRHQGKILITVNRHDLVRGFPNQPWPEVVAEFIRKIREHIGDETSDLFVPHFSTTGENEKAACQIALMNTVGQYFSFDLRTICGIPRITLEGGAEDWWLLVERASAFRRFGLDWWMDPLEVVLRQFALASEGKVNRPFWNSLYRMKSQSGGAAYSGWLSVFFPYLREKGSDACRSRLIPALASYLRDSGLDGNESFAEEGQIPFPCPGELPQGITFAPFVWEYLSQRIEMEFLGGFIGIEQDPNTLALRPEIGWAVCDAPVLRRETGYTVGDSSVVSPFSKSGTGAQFFRTIVKHLRRLSSFTARLN